MLIPNSIKELRSYASREMEGAALDLEMPEYNETEQQYLTALRQRLTASKTQRDQNHEQFDGMTYTERCEQNRRLAQTAVKPRENRAEVTFSTGTPRSKLLAHLAHLANLNLSADLTAYDENNFAVANMGEAVEDILEKLEDLEEGEEKKIRRIYTLFEQGEVFVERIWHEGYQLDKRLKNKEYKGKFRNVEWVELTKKALGGLQTNIIRNENVYLGDITKFDMTGQDGQPYVFTKQILSYSHLEPIFKGFEMWKHVSMLMKNWDSAFSFADATGFNPFWSLESVKKGFCEVIKYQSECDNEFQVLINGIPMYPPGFPMPWKHGRYSIEKQIAEIIDEHFAYGKSLMQRLKMAGALEDEMWRNVIFKFQQMLKPSMVNNTGRVLSSRIFMPGVMTPNIPEGKLKPLLEGFRDGMKGEGEILALLRSNMNDNSTEPQFNGQGAKGDQTATEISALQAQAEKVFGLAVLVASFLEQKLARLGVDLIMENYFSPIDTKIDEVRGTMQNVYRSINVEKPIEGRGMGQEVVMVAEDQQQVPSPYQIYNEEVKREEEAGIPTKIIVLNREEIKNSKYAWRVKCIPTPRRSTNMQKLMFKEQVATFSASPNFSLDWFEEKAATVYGENPQKVFKRLPTAAAGIPLPNGGDPRMDAAKMQPTEKKPSIAAVNQT